MIASWVPATQNQPSSHQIMNILKLVNGKVEIREDSGSLVRTIWNGDSSGARWHGSDIAIAISRGKTELRKESGALIRVI